MNIKPYELFILEKRLLKEANKQLVLNENANIYQEWINKIISEDSTNGMENLLEEMEALNELSPFKWIKDFAGKKLKLLKDKFSKLINPEMFKNVMDFITGGDMPKNRSQMKKLQKNDSNFGKALATVLNNQDPETAAKLGVDSDKDLIE